MSILNCRLPLMLLVLWLAVCADASAQDSPAPHRLDTRGSAESLPVPAVSLAELEGLALEQNPRLARAAYAISAAQGRALQAGLYPNPTVDVTFDELGDRTGRSGVNTLPLLTQEFVTAGKLRLSREAGMRGVDRASWELMSRRYALLSDVRTQFYEALALQTRIQILERMVALAERSVDQSNALLKAKQVARLDVVQLEIEGERLRAELEATERQLPAAYRSLAATVGNPYLAIQRVSGELMQPLPNYDLDAVQSMVLAAHPDVHAARYGVQQSRVLVQRAKVQPIPNVSINTGYVRQNQNQSDDFRIGASMSIPVWNRNQGNIRAADAEYGEALQQLRQVENELTERLAAATKDYAAARRRAERYQTAILPRAEETYDLSRQAYQGGEFEYLRVLEAQRVLAQAYLEYVRSLGDGWKSAAMISGLALEDVWPAVPAEVPPVPPETPAE